MLARLRKTAEEREGGFTLIELLVVIIIIGILAAIAIPVFLNQRQKGYDSQAKSDLRNMATAEETYLTDYKPSTNVTDVVMKNYSTANVLGTTADSGGYEVCVTSKSNAVFVYDSTKGGLLPANTPCA